MVACWLLLLQLLYLCAAQGQKSFAKQVPKKVVHRYMSTCVYVYVSVHLFRGLRPEAGNAGSRGDLSHILFRSLRNAIAVSKRTRAPA